MDSQLDHFKVLGIPRRLWVSADVVRRRFQDVSRDHHPDADGDAVEYALMVDAAAVLQDPAKRLPHWLELHGVDYDPRAVEPSPWVADEFSMIAAIVHDAGAAVSKRTAAASALGRAVAGRSVVEVNDRITDQLDALRGRADALEAVLVEMEMSGEADVDGVARCAVDFGFLGKWTSQLRGALASLVE